MLKSKLEKVLAVRYNGIDIEVKPGDILDVVDFGITAKEINGVELHVQNVHPNAFEKVSRGTYGLSNKEIDKTIDGLKASLEACDELRDSLKKTNEELTSENKELRAANQGLQGQIETGQKEIALLNAKLKNKEFPEGKNK